MTDNNKNTVTVSPDLLSRQREFCTLVREQLYTRTGGRKPTADVRVFGCQQNVSDGEHISGMLREMGYDPYTGEGDPDAVIFVTCAVRQHAEERVFGNVGELKHLKKRNPGAIVAVCGCMVQQQQVAEKLEKSYPQVDLIFGTHVLHRLPEFIYNVMMNGKRMTVIPQSDGVIAEGLPGIRDSGFKGFVPVMYGCNNFCTYCIVPYVRGRERSRQPQDVINEARELVESGCRDMTLLGQNVNSYGKTLENPVSFASLLSETAQLDGDFIVRFMTSHPKDCTVQLLETMAANRKIARHLHLPVQSGSDRILKLMNRHYDRERYLSLIDKARSLMPDITLTSDIIVGFPGETEKDFLDTLSLLKEVGYTSLFTFIYSPREGTPAAKMDDPVPAEEKKRWFNELIKTQEEISAGICAKKLGSVKRVLCEGRKKDTVIYEGRTEGNVMVEFEGCPGDTGNFINIEITGSKSWVLTGKKI